MLIRFTVSLGILVVFLGIVDHFRPPVQMYHLYSILNHLCVPRLWAERYLPFEFEITSTISLGECCLGQISC
jgi:hypothetical protein